MSKSASTSFIFANCKGSIASTISQIHRINNVESITPVTGRFDLVIRLRTNDPIKAFNALEKVRDVKGITSTQTALSFQAVTNGATETGEQPLAFALVKVKGTFQNVLQRIKSFPNFLEAHVIPGQFDVLAAFKGYSHQELLENSVEKLNTVNGITSSETLIAWNPTNTH